MNIKSKKLICFGLGAFLIFGALNLFKTPISNSSLETPLSSNSISIELNSLLGTGSDDYFASMDVDDLGNIYLGLCTTNSSFSTTENAYDTTYNGGSSDAVIMKLTPDASSIVWSTFLGGNGGDGIRCLKVLSNGNILVSGTAYSSTDYPTTIGAYDTSYNGGEDTFVSILSADGSELLYSTYLGTTQGDYNSGCDFNDAGEILIYGSTWGSSFPISPSANDTTFSGSTEGYITIMKGDLSDIINSTFVGGNDVDSITSAYFDNNGDVLFSGYSSSSSSIQITDNAYDSSNNGDRDGIIGRISYDLSNMMEMTYVGGLSTDELFRVCEDGLGNVVVFGKSDSTDYPTTSGVYGESHSSGTNDDLVISKFNPTLSSLISSTYFGSTSLEYSFDMIVDEITGDIYALAYTESSDFPLTPDAQDSSFSGTSSGSFFILSDDLVELKYSTFFGNEVLKQFSYSEISSRRTSSNSIELFFGITVSESSPTTPGVVNETFNGGYDLYFGKYVYSSASIPNKPILDAIESPDLDGIINLNWDDGLMVDNYSIFRDTSIISSINSLTPIETTIDSQYVDTLTNDGTYYYVIVANNETGSSIISNCESVIVDLPAPDAPVLDEITPNIDDDGIVQLNWNDVNNAENYYVYRDINPITNIASLSENVVAGNSYEDTILTEGIYYYVVVAVNCSTGISDISNCINVTVDLPGPSAPVLSSIEPAIDLDGDIFLNWEDVLYADNYDVYRNTSVISSLIGLSPIVTVSESEYVDNLLSEGTYYYVIVAINSSGQSSISNCESVVVDFTPATNGVWQDYIVGNNVLVCRDDNDFIWMEIHFYSASTGKLKLSSTRYNPVSVPEGDSRDFRIFYTINLIGNFADISSVSFAFYYGENDFIEDDDPILFELEGVNWEDRVSTHYELENKVYRAGLSIEGYYALGVFLDPPLDGSGSSSSGSQDEDENENENDFGGIPGFPIEFLCIGLGISIMVIKKKLEK